MGITPLQCGPTRTLTPSTLSYAFPSPLAVTVTRPRQSKESTKPVIIKPGNEQGDYVKLIIA